MATDSLVTHYERNLASHAHRPAIVSDSIRLSYSELHALTSRIAALICELPSDGTETVALMVGQEWLAVGMLGILKSGKCFVPLDYSESVTRLRSTLRDSAATLLVVDDGTEAMAEKTADRGVTLVDLQNAQASASQNVVPQQPSASDIACVLYTSGTTGDPKGVVFDHQSIAHMAMGNISSLGMTSQDRVALMSAPTFIGVKAAVFRSLLCGAALFPFDLRVRTVSELCDWLVEQRISVAQFVPTLFRDLCRWREQSGAPLQLRLIHLAGEAVHDQDIRLFDTHFPQAAALSYSHPPPRPRQLAVCRPGNLALVWTKNGTVAAAGKLRRDYSGGRYPSRLLRCNALSG